MGMCKQKKMFLKCWMKQAVICRWQGGDLPQSLGCCGRLVSTWDFQRHGWLKKKILASGTRFRKKEGGLAGPTKKVQNMGNVFCSLSIIVVSILVRILLSEKFAFTCAPPASGFCSAIP